MAEPKMGTKPAEGEEVDQKLIGGTILPKPQADVEGQYPYLTSCICPWCGSVLNIIADTAYFKWFTCCVCGGTFRF